MGEDFPEAHHHSVDEGENEIDGATSHKTGNTGKINIVFGHCVGGVGIYICGGC